MESDKVTTVFATRPDAAAAAKLVVVPAGPSSALQRLEPFLKVHGRLMPVGEEPHQVRSQQHRSTSHATMAI